MKECFAVLKVHNCRCSAWGMVYSRSYVSYLIFDMICANTARLVTVGCFPLMILHSIPQMGCDRSGIDPDLGSIPPGMNHLGSIPRDPIPHHYFTQAQDSVPADWDLELIRWIDSQFTLYMVYIGVQQSFICRLLLNFSI